MKKWIIVTCLLKVFYGCTNSNQIEKYNAEEKKHSGQHKESKGFLIEDKKVNQARNSVGEYNISSDIKNYLVGKIDFSQDKGFVLVDSRFTSKPTYLRTQVYEAFLKMQKAAAEDDISLIIISGARSFEHQKNIWERKWKNLPKSLPPLQKTMEILKYSSMPMSSRHHWGTDFDLNSLENKYFESGEGLKIYNWLSQNAYKFGFCQVYTDKKKTNRKGYEMEKWHWSYMPLSNRVLESYRKNITLSDITGFEGSELAGDAKIIQEFVNGIESCDDGTDMK